MKSDFSRIKTASVDFNVLYDKKYSKCIIYENNKRLKIKLEKYTNQSFIENNHVVFVVDCDKYIQRLG